MHGPNGTDNSRGDDLVIAWLLAGDPAIRWQVQRDLLAADPDVVAAERARVAAEGLGVRLLSGQGADGTWAGVAWNHGWNSTMHVLTLLREAGLDPASAAAVHALARVREQVTWADCGPSECAHHPYFAGETEPCINGQVAAAGAYFGHDVGPLIQRLLGEQLSDGGWNCDAERGSTRASFNTTICVLEALLEHEQQVGPTPAVTAARTRGEAYLLDRRLFRRRSTGEPIPYDRAQGPAAADGHPAWTRLAFPTWWHYDVLRGLEYLRRAGVPPDPRMAEAVAMVRSKQDGLGRWPLEVCYPGTLPVELDPGEGQPSRWNTLRALRVLRWYDAGSSQKF